MYDIQKLQREKKYENDKKILEIKIRDNIYKGTVDSVKAIQGEMETELKAKYRKHGDENESKEELDFHD